MFKKWKPLVDNDTFGAPLIFISKVFDCLSHGLLNGKSLKQEHSMVQYLILFSSTFSWWLVLILDITFFASYVDDKKPMRDQLKNKFCDQIIKITMYFTFELVKRKQA